jgi:hypothetical protein
MLYDYVAFALFSATASLGPSGAPAAAEVERMLAKLRPPGVTGPMGQSGVYKLHIAVERGRCFAARVVGQLDVSRGDGG